MRGSKYSRINLICFFFCLTSFDTKMISWMYRWKNLSLSSFFIVSSSKGWHRVFCLSRKAWHTEQNARVFGWVKEEEILPGLESRNIFVNGVQNWSFWWEKLSWGTREDFLVKLIFLEVLVVGNENFEGLPLNFGLRNITSKFFLPYFLRYVQALWSWKLYVWSHIFFYSVSQWMSSMDGILLSNCLVILVSF